MKNVYFELEVRLVPHSSVNSTSAPASESVDSNEAVRETAADGRPAAWAAAVMRAFTAAKFSAISTSLPIGPPMTIGRNQEKE